MKLDQQACGLMIFRDVGTSRQRAGVQLRQLHKALYEHKLYFDFRGVWRLNEKKSLDLELVWWGLPITREDWAAGASSVGWSAPEHAEFDVDGLLSGGKIL
jgi:hypothetical protein